MGAKFEEMGGELYIDGQKVIKGFESYTGWFWFVTEEAYRQDSIIDGRVAENDLIYFGYVQGLEDEWGYFSDGELRSLGPKIWEIKKGDLPYAGRR